MLIEKKSGNSIDEVVLEKTGNNLDDLVKNAAFLDSSDRNVIATKNLGIINGIGDNKFAPWNNISRQDVATLLKRTSQFLGKDSSNKVSNFADDAGIAPYAKEAVAFVSDLSIMNGVGNNTFAPRAPYTREQAYMTILRLYNNCK